MAQVQGRAMTNKRLEEMADKILTIVRGCKPMKIDDALKSEILSILSQVRREALADAIKVAMKKYICVKCGRISKAKGIADGIRNLAKGG